MPRRHTRQKKAAAAALVAVKEYALRKALKRKRGETVSAGETRVMLAYYYNSMRRDEKLSIAKSLRKTAQRLGFGVDSVTRAVDSFEENDGTIIVRSRAARGRSSRRKLDRDDTKVRLAKKLDELKATGSVTTRELQQWLASKPYKSSEIDKDRESVIVKAQTVARWLKRAGYVYVNNRQGWEQRPADDEPQ